MAEIVFAESAWDDLDSITDYISQDSVRYAQEFSDRLFNRLSQLTEFPESGRTVPEFKNPNLRELILGKYRIVYRTYNSEKIIVLRIIHGSKLLDQ